MRGMRLAAHEQMQEIYVLPPDEESVVTVKEKKWHCTDFISEREIPEA